MDHLDVVVVGQNSFWSTKMFQILRQEWRRRMLSGSKCYQQWKNVASTNGDTKSVQEDRDILERVDFSQLNPNQFGDLSQKFGPAGNRKRSKLLEKEDPDGFDQLEIKRGIKISLPAYERIMNEEFHKRPRNMNELLRLYREMVYVDRYRPSRHIFTMLFTACAQVGYTRKAVELFHEMKRFGLWPPTKASVTSLFNACANCSNGDSSYGLQNVILLREELETEGFQLNSTHYNALIKAFAKLGDMAAARNTLKEMMAKRLKVDLDTYSMLLMGCITDRENGLYLAVLIMQKILSTSGAKPDVSTFNLFLRCIRDCNIRNEDQVKKLFANAEKRLLPLLARKTKKDVLMIGQSQDSNQNLPNLLTGQNIGDMVAIDFQSLTLPRNRLLLFGGLEGFLRVMNSFQTVPDLKTLTLMTDMVDLDHGLEKIDQVLTRYRLKPDVCLYNVLVKKYAKGQRYSRCQEIIAHMQRHNIRPDIMTFGALTFCCTRMSHAKRLLKEMNQCELIPNHQILGSLVNIACRRQDLEYVRFLLRHFKLNGIKLTRLDSEQVEIFLAQVKKEIVQRDRNNNDANNSDSPELDEMYRETRALFQELLRQSSFEVDSNAWSQFESEDHHSSKGQINSVIRYMRKKIEARHGGPRPRPNREPDDDEVD